MKYIIKTFGCQMNFSDSERIMTFMRENGFTPLDDTNNSKLKTKEVIKADLIIFNTCGIRASSEHRVFGQINNILKLAKKKEKSSGTQSLPKIIVTGCSAHRDDFQKTLQGKVDLFTSIKDFPRALQKLNLLQEEEQEYKDYLSIQPQYKDSETAMVPIMTGCNNFCSYCVVPYARGREWSRPLKEIVKEIEILSDKNYKEVTLLGQNVNSYNTPYVKVVRVRGTRTLGGFSEQINFATLLDILAKQFPEIIFKFLTSHPKDCSMELIKVIKNNKNIPNELHLPIQAGSDKVLKDMNRPYTQKYYLDLISKVRKEIPNIKITTDIIIGFPTETDDDFEKTIKVFKKVKYAGAFLNKYSPRPGTASYKLGDPIPWKVKKEREKMLLELLEEN